MRERGVDNVGSRGLSYIPCCEGMLIRDGQLLRCVTPEALQSPHVLEVTAIQGR
jgi:hypothetical protein